MLRVVITKNLNTKGVKEIEIRKKVVKEIPLEDYY